MVSTFFLMSFRIQMQIKSGVAQSILSCLSVGRASERIGRTAGRCPPVFRKRPGRRGPVPGGRRSRRGAFL